MIRVAGRHELNESSLVIQPALHQGGDDGGESAHE